MVAYRMVAWGEAPRLTEAPVPAPGPGEVLVEVAGNGLCHSDLGMAQVPAAVAGALGWQLPFTLGHEVGGHVAALGAGVDGPPAVGDPVVLVSPASCGTCPACRRGHDSACPHGSAGRGYGRDGGLARYVVAPRRDIVPVDGLDPVSAAPLTDAGATAHHAVARVAPRLTAGTTAVVIGAGGLGGFAVQLLRALTDARVVAVDTAPARRDRARGLGAHEVADEAGAVDAAEVVLDFVGTDDTIAAGLGAVAPYGAFGLVGAEGGTFRRPWFGGLPRDAEVFTFQGSSRADVAAVVALARSGAVRSDVEVYPLSRVEEACAALAGAEVRGRAVVVPDL